MRRVYIRADFQLCCHAIALCRLNTPRCTRYMNFGIRSDASYIVGQRIVHLPVESKWICWFYRLKGELWNSLMYSSLDPVRSVVNDDSQRTFGSQRYETLSECNRGRQSAPLFGVPPRRRSRRRARREYNHPKWNSYKYVPTARLISRAGW